MIHGKFYILKVRLNNDIIFLWGKDAVSGNGLQDLSIEFSLSPNFRLSTGRNGDFVLRLTAPSSSARRETMPSKTKSYKSRRLTMPKKTARKFGAALARWVSEHEKSHPQPISSYSSNTIHEQSDHYWYFWCAKRSVAERERERERKREREKQKKKEEKLRVLWRRNYPARKVLLYVELLAGSAFWAPMAGDLSHSPRYYLMLCPGPQSAALYNNKKRLAGVWGRYFTPAISHILKPQTWREFYVYIQEIM